MPFRWITAVKRNSPSIKFYPRMGCYHSNKMTHRLLEMAVCVIVSDHNNGQALAKVYFEDQP